MRKHEQAAKDWIADADEVYRQTLRSSTSTQSKPELRQLQVRDSVSLRVQDLNNRDTNAGADTWDGPWEVLEAGDPEINDHSITDYLIQRSGSRQQPKWQHIDNLKQTFKSTTEQQLLKPVDEQAIMKEAALTHGGNQQRTCIARQKSWRGTHWIMSKKQSRQQKHLSQTLKIST